jgi:hypothetical protein
VRAAGAPRERVHGAYVPVGWGGVDVLLTGGEKALLVDVWAVSRNTGSRVWSGIKATLLLLQPVVVAARCCRQHLPMPCAFVLFGLQVHGQ